MKSIIQTAFKLSTLLIFIVSLSACSNNAKNTTNTNNKAVNQQTVETGTVVSARTIKIEPQEYGPYGANVGVSGGSGGVGVFGSIDLVTLGRLFKNVTGPKIAQEVIVKKSNGETVAITQKAKETFKAGDKVKILLRNGEARVIH